MSYLLAIILGCLLGELALRIGGHRKKPLKKPSKESKLSKFKLYYEDLE